ncbi:MAG TPA: hypothetical protein VKA60_12210 [Blastocatellia bacterium]|nr:hypothetical protein [Blastocatellia bacterium]
MSSPTFGEKLKDIRKSFNRRYCLHPNAGSQCSHQIIKAHTIQRSGSLTKLAKNQHIYTFHPGDAELMKTGMLSPRRIGINKASTFTGFCDFHDNATFAPIENHTFESTPKHTFLLSYRALCREFYMKRARVEHISSIRTFDKGAPVEKQIWWMAQVSAMERGERSSLRHLERYKSIYDHCLLTEDYVEVQYYVIRIGCTPDFVCSGCVFPDYDFSGNKLQTLTNLDEIPQLISFSVLASDLGGLAVFGWVGPTPTAVKLVQTLDSLPNDQISHALVRFSFEYVENIFMSIDWWDQLAERVKSKLILRSLTGARPDLERRFDCLADDGLRIVSWPVLARQTNIDFTT